MIEQLSKLTPPGAIVICFGIIAIACIVIAFFVAATGSKFPWEK